MAGPVLRTDGVPCDCNRVGSYYRTEDSNRQDIVYTIDANLLESNHVVRQKRRLFSKINPAESSVVSGTDSSGNGGPRESPK